MFKLGNRVYCPSVDQNGVISGITVFSDSFASRYNTRIDYFVEFEIDNEVDGWFSADELTPM